MRTLGSCITCLCSCKTNLAEVSHIPWGWGWGAGEGRWMVLRMEAERPVWKFLRGLGKQMEAACYVVAVMKTEECVMNV